MKITKLESIRGFVALYVVIHHLILFTQLYPLTPEPIRLLFRFGREAVLVFFLLSGFVICIAINKSKNEGITRYFMKRFLRIYPILTATFCISILVFHLNGDLHFNGLLKSLVLNILQLQRLEDEPGIEIEISPFLGNLPLWSLGYEWWFYMMFILITIILRVWKRDFSPIDIYLVLIISLSSWACFTFIPSHLFLVINFFLLWWTGYHCAEIYYVHKDFKLKNMVHPLICLCIMTLIIGVPVLKQRFIDNLSIAEINQEYPLTNYLYNYIEAILLLLCGWAWWKIKLFKFNFLFGLFSKIAPISYAIYVIHFPVIQLQIPVVGNIYLLLVIKIILILAISYFLEIVFQPWIIQLYKKYISKKEGLFSRL
jgi:peptidoglycan/LPS O-acetylase OafA/YrhL